MAKILVNFFKDGNKIRLLRNNPVVFADQPFAVYDTDKEEPADPILIPGPGGMLMVTDKQEFLATHTLYNLKEEPVPGDPTRVKLVEDPNGEATYLPKGTDIKYVYKNLRTKQLEMIKPKEEVKANPVHKNSKKEPKDQSN